MPTSQRLYRGIRKSDGTVAVMVDHGQLPPRLDLKPLSPSGFEWDASEAGPAQLALALAAHHLHNDEKALAVYRDLRRTLVRTFSSEGWTLTGEDLGAAIEKVESQQALARLEEQMGYVIQAHCKRCGAHHTFWGKDRTAATGHMEAAGWRDLLGDSGVVDRVCGVCEAGRTA